MYVGTITLFRNDRGFGFITTTDGKQYFFHISNFVRGQAPPVLQGRVCFEIGPAIEVGKKPQAISIQYIGKKQIASPTAADVAAGFAGTKESDGGAA